MFCLMRTLAVVAVILLAAIAYRESHAQQRPDLPNPAMSIPDACRTIVARARASRRDFDPAPDFDRCVDGEVRARDFLRQVWPRVGPYWLNECARVANQHPPFLYQAMAECLLPTGTPAR